MARRRHRKQRGSASTVHNNARDGKSKVAGWIRASSSLRERGEGRVILEAGCECVSTLDTELVRVETAATDGSACVNTKAGPMWFGFEIAAHMSSFSTSFPLMQPAMMTAEATARSFPARLIDSVGFVPFSSSIGSAWPSTLPACRTHDVQWR